MNTTTLAATLWWVDDSWGHGKDGPYCFEDADLEYVVQEFLERTSRRERRRWRQAAKLLKAQDRPRADLVAARAQENLEALRRAVGRRVHGVEHLPPYRGTFVLTFMGDDFTLAGDSVTLRGSGLKRTLPAAEAKVEATGEARRRTHRTPRPRKSVG